MKYQTISPSTGLVLNTYTYHTRAEIDEKITLAQSTYLSWSQQPITKRLELLQTVSQLLITQKNELAILIVKEVGKRLVDAQAEIEKCALVCTYYANEAAKILAPKIIKTEAKKSYVRHDPLGVCLAIMPWNFPFWQVFRAAAPALVAGNSMILKHASNVPECALAIERLFLQANAPKGLFQSVLIPGSETAQIISDPRLRKISLTGSEQAGIQVAKLAGGNLIPTVLELGGSDPFIIFPDADLSLAVQAATTSRLIVSGQSCIAAKRFIVHEHIYDAFLTQFKDSLASKKLGDPLDPNTDLGPLINQTAINILQEQVDQSIKSGAKLLTGGKQDPRPGYYYQPTILANVTPKMRVFSEETFGPVAAVIKFSSNQEALDLANHPHFGLGSSVWTKNQEIIELFTTKLEAGSVFVNTFVKSDPRLPFGGTKKSGYGRELSVEGLYEYTNIKTIWIN